MRTLREAAWAPLAVLCLVVAAEKLFDAFSRLPWFDAPAHVLGGIAVTHFFWRAIANARAAGKIGRDLLAFACTASIAILWELLEFGSDRVLLTRLQHGAGDTLSDLVFGLGGALAYLLLRRALAPASAS